MFAEDARPLETCALHLLRILKFFFFSSAVTKAKRTPLQMHSMKSLIKMYIKGCGARIRLCKVDFALQGPYQSLSFMSNFLLMLSPYRFRTHGTGIHASAMNPKRLFPQPRPRVSYIFGPARGKTAPMTLRISVLAARTLAA